MVQGDGMCEEQLGSALEHVSDHGGVSIRFIPFPEGLLCLGLPLVYLLHAAHIPGR